MARTIQKHLSDDGCEYDSLDGAERRDRIVEYVRDFVTRRTQITDKARFKGRVTEIADSVEQYIEQHFDEPADPAAEFIAGADPDVPGDVEPEPLAA